MSCTYLFSRLRLAVIKPTEQRHPNAPLARSTPQLRGSFIQTSLPSWAANTLVRSDLPRGAAAFFANRRKTGASYLVHGLQCGTLQLRTVIPVASSSAKALFTHLAEQQHVSAICYVDESTQAIELAIALDKEAAVRALAAPSVLMTDAVLHDEAEMVFSLVHAPSMPSLTPGQDVRDVLVLFCGDLALPAGQDSPLSSSSRQNSSTPVH